MPTLSNKNKQYKLKDFYVFTHGLFIGTMENINTDIEVGDKVTIDLDSDGRFVHSMTVSYLKDNRIKCEGAKPVKLTSNEDDLF